MCLGMEDARIAARMKSQLMVSAMSKSSSESSRLASIDAARGAAMLFVCLSHFAASYHFAANAVAGETGDYLRAVGMVASPTFVVVSGMVAGFIAVARKRSFPHFRRKLVDRGVFLLLVGHAVLAFTGVLGGTGLAYSYSIGYVTDAIGVAIIIGPWLVVKLRQRSRILLSAALFALDWGAILFWKPSEGIAGLANQYLVGLLNPADVGVTFLAFPVIPWFAVYLVGTVIGEHVGAFYVRGSHRHAHLLLAKIGVSSLTFGVGAKLALILLRRLVPNFAQVHQNLIPLLSTYQKYPPGPIYVCFYAGAGFLLVAGVLEAERRGIQTFLLNRLRQIGHASLFSYVVQFDLYSVILPRLRLPYTPFWPFLFVFSLVVLTTAAAAWNSIEGNRFLTVGIGPLLERNAIRRLNVHEGQIRVDIAATEEDTQSGGLRVTPTAFDAIYRLSQFQNRKRVS